jgi:hypothetical protein
MRSVTIERLSVHAKGLGPEQARRLERLLGELLRAPRSDPPARPGAAPDAVDELARSIVAEIASELRRHV